MDLIAPTRRHLLGTVASLGALPIVSPPAGAAGAQTLAEPPSPPAATTELQVNGQRLALALDPSHRGATEYYGELKVLKGDMAGAKAMLARLDSVCTYGCAEAVELRLWIDHGGDPAA